MKKPEKDEIPLVNIERNPFWMLLWVILNGCIVFLTYFLFKNMNPWGFIIMIPALLMSFLTLWLLVNPFAIFFEDKLELKQSFFNNSTLYFIDVKSVVDVKGGRLKIIYNDDDREAFVIFGIKNSHKSLLKSSLESFVSQSIQKRDK